MKQLDESNRRITTNNDEPCFVRTILDHQPQAPVARTTFEGPLSRVNKDTTDLRYVRVVISSRTDLVGGRVCHIRADQSHLERRSATVIPRE